MSAATLPILLRSLGLTTMAREHDDTLARAEAEHWGYPRFLRHLVETEANERLRRRVERLLKDSRLPAGKTLASLDQARLPEKVRRQLPTLLTGEFIRRGDNLLCFGLPGRGKTLFLAALCRELVQQQQLPVFYTTAHRLVTELLVAKRELKLERLIAKFDRFAALAIDDLGYTQQSREEMEVLFTLLAERYEKKSVLLTSNLVPSQWDQIFKDPMMTMAAVDRLVHHAVILEFNGRSYRADAAETAKTKPTV
jgi:DNA replication protein DnaC